MATTAENPGTVKGFSRLFGVDPGFFFFFQVKNDIQYIMWDRNFC